MLREITCNSKSEPRDGIHATYIPLFSIISWRRARQRGEYIFLANKIATANVASGVLNKWVNTKSHALNFGISKDQSILQLNTSVNTLFYFHHLHSAILLCLKGAGHRVLSLSPKPGQPTAPKCHRVKRRGV